MKRTVEVVLALTVVACGAVAGCGGSGINNNLGGDMGTTNVLPEANPVGMTDGPVSRGPDLNFGKCYPSPPTSAKGVVYAPNGTDPVSGATIYTTATMPAALGTASCQACAAAPTGSLTSTNSDVNGNFTLPIPDTAQYLVIELGHFRRVIPTSSLMSCAANALTAAQTSLPQQSDSMGNMVPKIAVTTGSQDHMQNILLKLGLSANAFDVYEGRNPVPTTSATESHCVAINTANATTCTADQLFGSLATMQMYDIIFVDCHNSYEKTLLTNPAVVANLQTYAAKGGRMFVDDESFEYVEQAFPEPLSWEPSPTMGSSTPETDYTSKYETHGDFGVGGKVGAPTAYPANINTADTSGKPAALAQWLTARGVSLGAMSSFMSQGFLNYWAVMGPVNPSGMFAASALAGYRYNTITWVNGAVSWYTACATSPCPTMSGTAPLSVSFDLHGLDAASCGRVLFNSYHTNPGSGGENTACTSAASCTAMTAPGTTACSPLGFCWNPAWTDQERILEYLVLDVGTCIKPIG